MRTYISLFSSAGIGCYGFKENNFECVATNEIIERRLSIQKINNKCKYDTGYILGNIENEDVKNEIFNQIKKWEHIEKIKEVDVVIATPPCQGMSVANHKKKDEKKRNSLVVEAITIILSIKPKYIILENVPNFLTTICTDVDNVDKNISDVIENNLYPFYNIKAQVINFKNYGANSSRKRTLIIGIRKDVKNITPNNLFPDLEEEKSLKDVIGKLNTLDNMGEFDKKDIYHFFRSYDKRMLEWIMNTKEGLSAFDNINDLHKPHKIENGKIILNTNKNGDKYKRCLWNKVAPCIHTRNDVLASQSTVHPKDNRVFSLRELMLLMNIPTSFKWASESENCLNELSNDEKIQFFKKNEINIRQSIGEAVPTIIFSKIANNIIQYETADITKKDIDKIIVNIKNGLLSKNEFIIQSLFNKYSLPVLFNVLEMLNPNRETKSAYYTPQSICFDIIQYLPSIKKETISILEPSIGIGNFLPSLIDKYKDKRLEIDVFDLDANVLEDSKLIISNLIKDRNIIVNYINDDFLLNDNKGKSYDIVIANPPYGKIDKNIFKKICSQFTNNKTKNLFSFFLEKSIKLSDFVAFIIPKSFLNSPEYDLTRSFVETNTSVKTIIDFGEKAFYGVKIETIGLVLECKNKKTTDIIVKSYIKDTITYQSNSNIFDKDFNMWLLYKDDVFNSLKQEMKFGVFDVFRDRQITKSMCKNNGKFRVINSQNLTKQGEVIFTPADVYIDDINNLSVARFLNKDVFLIPNLSYYPRAGKLPKNCIPNGSLAVINLKEGFRINEKDISFFSNARFQYFYKVGRNYGTRSLNIDRNSIKLWGIKK